MFDKYLLFLRRKNAVINGLAGKLLLASILIGGVAIAVDSLLPYSQLWNMFRSIAVMFPLAVTISSFFYVKRVNADLADDNIQRAKDKYSADQRRNLAIFAFAGLLLFVIVFASNPSRVQTLLSALVTSATFGLLDFAMPTEIEKEKKENMVVDFRDIPINPELVDAMKELEDESNGE